MADISKEIQAFKEAVKGKEVRGSMVSLAEKVNRELETNTGDVAAAVGRANTAASNANTATGKTLIATDTANTASLNANKAATNANAASKDIQDRLSRGEFKGDKGEKGDTGQQGASGIMAPASGMFSLFLDPATGDIYADYPDGDTPPAFEYDATTGDLYYITGGVE